MFFFSPFTAEAKLLMPVVDESSFFFTFPGIFVLLILSHTKQKFGNKFLICEKSEYIATKIRHGYLLSFIELHNNVCNGTCGI